jgi:hypothetical protein
MTDLSMTWTALRRNMGVASLGREETTETSGQPLDQTPGTWSGARAGTSRQSSGFLYGAAETAYSQEGNRDTVPALVSIRLDGRNLAAKKYKMFEVPRRDQGLEEFCFCLIGEGTTFCTARHCKTTHQGTTFGPLPGSLFVAKTATTAFADPKSSLSFLTPGLVVEWNSSSFTLEEWSQLFMLVNNSTSKIPTLAATLEAQSDFASRAKAHRTPGKRKAAPPISPLWV